MKAGTFLPVGLAMAIATGGFAKPKPAPDVLVVADNFQKERSEIVPTPDRPVYYIILGGMEWTIGLPVGGERLPKEEELEEQITSALEPLGYLRTTVGGPMPELVLTYTFGGANLEFDSIERTVFSPEGEESSETFSRAVNSRQICSLIGINRARGRMLSGTEAAELNDAANEDRIYLMVAALDARELLKKKKTCVWRTWMSVTSTGNWLNESIPTMLASGAPWFGKETAMPTFITESDRRARVEFGELRVVPDGEETP